MSRPQAESQQDRRLVVRTGEPLIGVFLDPESDDVTYVASEEEADAAIPESAIDEARAAAGSWADLDWDEVEAELGRIRHGRVLALPMPE
jgi:hypothetical protein